MRHVPSALLFIRAITVSSFTPRVEFHHGISSTKLIKSNLVLHSSVNTPPVGKTKTTTKPLPLHWEVGPTLDNPNPTPLPSKLLNALETNTHPEESQSELGLGVFITEDWRKAWYTYQSPPEDPDLICERTGEAEYEITEIDGELPKDLVGVLYRNGPGKFGVNGERVLHILDADGLIMKVDFVESGPDGKRKVMFR